MNVYDRNVGWLFLVIFLSGSAVAKEATDTTKKRKAPWLRYCNERVGNYQIYPTRKRDGAFQRLPSPIMLHTQATRGKQTGAIYLWVDNEKRPAVVGTTILQRESEETHFLVEEFHSLTQVGVSANLAGRTWRWSDPGITWKPLNAKPAKGSKTLVRAHARKLIREFSAFAIERTGNVQRPLRIQPNPVYEYSPKSEKTTSGFVFAGCLTTDPEFFLLLESRKAKTNGQNRWHYAFAWFSDMVVQAQFKDKDIWKSPRNFGGPHIGNKTVTGIRLPED